MTNLQPFNLEKFYRSKNNEGYILEKLVSNQIINTKPLSKMKFEKLVFSDCTLKSTHFYYTKCMDLVFQNCILEDVSFHDAILIDFKFENCKLNNIFFSFSEIEELKIKNCHF